MTSHMPWRGPRFGQRHSLRRVAAQVLFAWLFALAAGIVNACLLEPQSRQGSAAAMHDSAAASASIPGHDAPASGGQHPASPTADKASCVKFCDDPSAGAQGVKQKLDPSGSAGLAPLPARPVRIEAAPRTAGARAAEHGRWRPAVPIAIAFLRLTL